MTTLTMPQIAQVLRAGGWPEAQLVTAVAVIMAESGGVIEAVNTANRNGSIDRGLMQINSIHNYDAQLLVTDPLYNVRCGLEIFNRAGGSWTPWSSYNSGSHLQYMEAAALAVSGSTLAPPPFPERLTPLERLAVYGDPYDPVYPQVSYTTPWGITVSINAAIYEVFRQASIAAYLDAWNPVQIQTFNIRPNANSGDSWSLHSWGLAGDFFAQMNPDDVWTPTNPVTPSFANHYIRWGFTWGGNFTSRIDLPHIEWAGAPPGDEWQPSDHWLVDRLYPGRYSCSPTLRRNPGDWGTIILPDIVTTGPITSEPVVRPPVARGPQYGGGTAVLPRDDGNCDTKHRDVIFESLQNPQGGGMP